MSSELSIILEKNTKNHPHGHTGADVVFCRTLWTGRAFQDMLDARCPAGRAFRLYILNIKFTGTCNE